MSITSITKNTFPEIYTQYCRYFVLYNTDAISKLPLYHFTIPFKMSLVRILEDFLTGKDIDFKIKFSVESARNNYTLIDQSVYSPGFINILKELKQVAKG